MAYVCPAVCLSHVFIVALLLSVLHFLATVSEIWCNIPRLKCRLETSILNIYSAINIFLYHPYRAFASI